MEGGGLRGASIGQASTAREASMSQAIEQFDPIIKQFEETRQGLENLLSRVFGPHPTAVEDRSPTQAPPASMIGGLNVRARILERLSSDLGELARRLDQVL